MKKILAFLLAAMMVLAFAACGEDNGGTPTPTPDVKGMSADVLPRNAMTPSVEIPADFKIGMICLHDENSTYDNNFIQALRQVQKDLGLSDDQVVIVTNIGEDSSCYDAAVDLAKNKGCKVIFADSFGHESFMKQAAQEYPEVQFCHATGTSGKIANIENFHNAFASIYEGRYLAGIAAGLKLNEMIAAGKITAEQAVIGYVGAFTYAEVISGMTSFYLGARSVCPSATMKVRYTGSWYDQAKEQEAATALIEKDKCVLISQHADSLGAPTACELAGVPNVSYNGSTYSAGETTFIISSAINWAPYFQYIIETVVKGEAIAPDWCGTIATNSVVLSGVNQDVAAEGTIEKINEAIKALEAGTLHVFDTANFTVDGKTLTEYLADVDGDYTGETNVIHDGYFDESNAVDFRSAPYFDIIIDGVTNLNTNFGG
ncbi:MAG: BMP family ABC transporter substrate-binding protein [Angelakisella sp.]|jgi:bmp family protein|nr:BMP family ABC transporter substrate-binding protein [Angelakisella sp.]MBS6850608.1 BMP family ABC transporter substrate-binding protein [Clostridiales bacterium]